MTKLTFVLILLAIFSITSYAGDFCPEKIQAVLLTKVLSFTREIGGAPKGAINLGVVGGGPIMAALEKSAAKAADKITVKKISADQIGTVNVVYLPKGVATDIVQNASILSKSSKIMTVAGDPQMLMNYDLTLTFHLVNGKPRMLVSMESAEEEGVKFAAAFLKIAEKK